MADSDLRRCVRSVLALGQDLDATSIAEALWLAAASPVTGPAIEPTAAGVMDQADVKEEPRSSSERMEPTPPRPQTPDPQGVPSRDPDALTDIEALVPGRRVRVQQAKGGPQPLDLSRSLRPFKRRWPDGKRLQLDIEATVRSYARTWKLIPEFRPAPERWFDADIVIDDSPSMTVWGDMVSVLSTLLRQVGAFRSIRTWRMSVTGTTPVLRNEGGQPTGTGQLRSPGGRRLIIVVSDGSAAGWFRPEVWQLVRTWAGSTPTALISPLATRLWGRTGLGLPTVRVGPGSPGSRNALLKYSVPYTEQLGAGNDLGESRDEDWLPLPVATLSPHMLGRWARMLMKGDPRGCDALLIPLVRRPPEQDTDDGSVTSANLVDAFRRSASPEAGRLAVLCAPFSAVSLPLLELLCQELVPTASTGDLAEVVVGGLFRPPTAGPDGGLLRFRAGVRDRLRHLLPEVDAWRTYEVLINHIAARAGLSATFAAGVPDPLGDIALPADLLPLAAASREALEFLDALPATWRDQPLITVAPPAADPAVPAIWDNVPLRDMHFTGRGRALQQIQEWISRSSAVPSLYCLHGLGGVGKTAIAAEYAYRYRAEYDLVWWVQSDQLPQVRWSLAALAARLGLAAADTGVEEAARAALDALRAGEPSGRWLLIFDHADQPEEISQYIPPGPGDVLITSRNPAWDRFSPSIPLDVFTRAESIEFLIKRTARSVTGADADVLADRLGDLPLALEQAGAVIAETGMAATEYLELLNEQVAQDKAAGAQPDYPQFVKAATAVAAARLRQANSTAYELLRFLAFFGPEPVPRDVLRRRERSAMPLLNELLADPLQLARAIRYLTRWGLASLNPAGRAISVHPVTAAIVRDEVDPDEWADYQHEDHLLLATAAPPDPADSTQWRYYGELAAHVRPTDLAACHDVNVRAFALDVLRYLSLSGDLDSCRSLASDFIERWTHDSGEDDPHVQLARLQLGETLRQLGDYPGSYGVTEEALRNARASLGDQAAVTLDLRDSLGQDLRLRGDFPGARSLDQDTRDIQQAVAGKTAPQTLRAMNNLGLDQLLTGDYPAARDLLDRVRVLRIEEGVPAADIVTTWNYLSWATRLCGDYPTARDVSRDAWNYGRARLGSGHPATLRAANGLAIALRRLGPSAAVEAMEIVTEVVRQCDRVLGPAHPDMLAALASLSNTQLAMGRFDEALALAERLTSEYSQRYGPGHPFTHGSLGNLALLRRRMGDPAGARRLDETALDGLYGRLTPDHHYPLTVAINLATDLAALGEAHQARVLGEDALRRSRTLLGEDHPVTLGCAANLAMDLRADGDLGYADRVHSDTMSRYVRGLGGDHPDTQAALASQRLDFDFDPPPL